MSGVYIKGIEMPKNCRECCFLNGEADTEYGVCARCMVDGKDRDAYTTQDCPILPVPDHGDLIDMTAKMSVQDRFDDNIVSQMTVKELIHEYIVGGYPKTIIPADKEDEE